MMAMEIPAELHQRSVSVTAVNDVPALLVVEMSFSSEKGTRFCSVVNNSLTLSDAEATVVNRVEVVLAGAGSGER